MVEEEVAVVVFVWFERKSRVEGRRKKKLFSLLNSTHRAVLAQLIRVEQHHGLLVASRGSHRVHHALRLQARVVRVDVTAKERESERERGKEGKREREKERKAR